ncbi:hypothetical protein SAMN05421811_1281 [Nonomuraea wenchangensis]|uniref:Uncharacterized protein n=1 Tax=Nonomuraea wenchangensis TaxID=568860 RepID=A0A1I0LUD6_9ACTN|nr:hypothetical protein SAMN05421811_1281 [Nonomuraea wenchangensis]
MTWAVTGRPPAVPATVNVPGGGVLLRVHCRPGDGQVAVVAVGEGGADGGRKCGRGADGRPHVEGVLAEAGGRRRGAARHLGHLLGRERRGVDAEVVDRAVEQRVGIERAPDEPGGRRRGVDQLRGGDRGGGGGDGGPVEVGRDPLGRRVEGDGQRLPGVRGKRGVAGDLRLRAAARRGDRGAQPPVAVVRGAEQVSAVVLAQRVDPLPGGRGAVPLDPRGHGQVGPVLDRGQRQPDVGAVGGRGAAGQAECVPARRAVDQRRGGRVDQLAVQAVAGGVGDGGGGDVVGVELVDEHGGRSGGGGRDPRGERKGECRRKESCQ